MLYLHYTGLDSALKKLINNVLQLNRSPEVSGFTETLNLLYNVQVK